MQIQHEKEFFNKVTELLNKNIVSVAKTTVGGQLLTIFFIPHLKDKVYFSAIIFFSEYDFVFDKLAYPIELLKKRFNAAYERFMVKNNIQAAKPLIEFDEISKEDFINLMESIGMSGISSVMNPPIANIPGNVRPEDIVIQDSF